MSLNAIKQAIKSAGYAKYVADISEDPEIYEVQLREPWINTEYHETLWVYGKHHLDGGSSPARHARRSQVLDDGN